MRVWIDLANSPHVPLFVPLIERIRGEGFDVLVTCRNHAQTALLATREWPDVVVIGEPSPPGRVAKARAIAARATELRLFARHATPDAALSHGSYAQLVAARLAGVPAVTMMDYEHQPANHLSFRLARKVIVPEAFPDAALRRFGARPGKVIRYPGFKEELYLADFVPDASVLDLLRLDSEDILVVMRPPPHGALYHREANPRFDEILGLALKEGVRVVLLPRSAAQAEHYRKWKGVTVADSPLDGPSLLACADLVIGAGGTMNREAALVGTPTYTIFAGRLAAVDAELIRRGLLRDLRASGVRPVFEKRAERRPATDGAHRDASLEVVVRALRSITA